MTITQEVPVSRSFEAYPAKPPQARKIILNRLFLMMKTENNHRAQLAVAAVADSAYYLLIYNEIKKFTIS
jgi:hypothetical protein